MLLGHLDTIKDANEGDFAVSAFTRITEQEYPSEEEGPYTLDELDDKLLDVFLPDEEQETLPEQGDFWIENFESD